MEDVRKMISDEFWSQGWNLHSLSVQSSSNRQSIERFLFDDGEIKLGMLCKICDAMGLEIVIRKCEVNK